MSSEDNGKEESLSSSSNVVDDNSHTIDTVADAEKDKADSSDIDTPLPSERETAVMGEPVAENGRDLLSERDGITSLKERETAVMGEPVAENCRDLLSERDGISSLKENDVIEKQVLGGDQTNEQPPVDKIELEPKIGNATGEL